MKKIFAIVALLMVSVTLTARQKPADQGEAATPGTRAGYGSAPL